MATNAQWTVIFDDKLIQKNYAENKWHIIDDASFWANPAYSNFWAVQYGTSVATDEVEYRDETPHSTWEDANLGDFSDFTNRWDAAHLAQLQSTWDNNNVEGETEEDKIARLGARPTSYSS